MPSDNEILEMLSSSGEDHEDGPTELKRDLECARRRRLDNEMEEADVFADHNEGRNIGTLVHKMVEAYHSGQDPEEYIPLRSDDPNIDKLLNGPLAKRCSAWQLFRRYEAQFEPGFWGHLVAAEQRLIGEFKGKRRTGRLDSIFQLDDQALARIENRFNIELFGQGNYVWDLKTGGQKDNIMEERYRWHPQPTQYTWLAQEHGFDPQGMIVFKAVTYKTERQDSFYAVAFSAEELLSKEGLARYSQQLMEAEANVLDDFANTTNCDAYNRICPHRVSGACNGGYDAGE